MSLHGLNAARQFENVDSGVKSPKFWLHEYKETSSLDTHRENAETAGKVDVLRPTSLSCAIIPKAL